MRITVVDTETTGDTETDQVVELAVVTLGQGPCRACGQDADQCDLTECPVTPMREWSITSAWSTLVRPTVPVHPAARACHHITDAELAAAPDRDQVTCPIGTLDADFAVAHNAPFDARMLVQTWGWELDPAKVIDTYRCARHLWPEAPSYKNQVLRYWLPGLDEETRRTSLAWGHDDRPQPAPMALPPHRALPDAWVTAHILLRMLRDHTPEHLASLTSQPVLLPSFPVGEYRGQPFSSVPISMLKWMLERETQDEDLVHTCRHWVSSPDRAPLLLDTIRFGAFRGRPFSELRTDYLQWILSRDFDADVKHTARTVLEQRSAR